MMTLRALFGRSVRAVHSGTVAVRHGGKDPYRSRVPASEVVEDGLVPCVGRPDPVVWGDERSAHAAGPLSASDLHAFDRDGFLILRGAAADPAGLANLREACLSRAEEWRRAFEGEAGKEEDREVGVKRAVECVGRHCIPEPKEAGAPRPLLRSVFGPHLDGLAGPWAAGNGSGAAGEDGDAGDVNDSSSPYALLVRHRAILGTARQLLGGDVYIHQSRVNLQPAFWGTGFYWHSDFETWHSEDAMPRPRALSAMVMLTENSRSNGALMVMPGSHRTYVPCIGETPSSNWDSSLSRMLVGLPSPKNIERLANEHGIVSCEGSPGDVLLFDSNILHGSHSNITPYPRTNAFYVLNSVDNRLEEQPCGDVRPEYLASRNPRATVPLTMID